MDWFLYDIGLRYERVNSVKINKIKIMTWETDKRWLYELCNDYTTIEYQIAIDKKARAIEIQTKMLR